MNNEEKAQVIREILDKNRQELKSISNPGMGPHKTLYEALLYLIDLVSPIEPLAYTEFSRAFDDSYR